MEKKAQVSAEYLILLSFILAFTLVMFVLLQSYGQEAKDSIRLTQADQIAQKLVDTAEEVFYLGEPSKITVRISMPENVESVSIGNKELYFVINTQQGNNEVGCISKINITGSLPLSPGNYDVVVESKGDYVLVHV
jgi:uncharacterized protein (UPF0333 family)